MKRRLIQLVVLVLAGAIVNIAVAWGCAWTFQPITVECCIEENVHSSSGYWSFLHSGNIGSRRVAGWRTKGCWDYYRVPDWPAYITHVESTRWREVSDGNRQLQAYPIQDSRGWPCLAMWCEFVGDTAIGWSITPTTGGIGLESRTSSGPIYSDRFNDLRALPLWPLLPGFAINTIFYAAILWIFFALPGTIRRSMRRRRGLCSKCTYPTGESPICTECGAAVK